nr:putative ribonuclease H-like domain-containing protein [Tanacetum cinerariifolium]
LKVKVIRSDNGTEFKNNDLNQFYGIKGIKREFNVPRTLQQNGIAERNNRTLIKAARTMLADLLLPIPFWAETVNTACYVHNRVRTRIVQETLHVIFLENKPNFTSSGPTWMFDIDSITRTMNYQPVNARNQTNLSAGFQDKFDAEKAGEEVDQQYVLFLVWSSVSTNPHNNDRDAAFNGKEHDFDANKPKSEVSVSPSNSAQSRKQDDKTKKEAKGKKDITYSDDEDIVGAEADFNNLETSIKVNPIPTTRVHKDHTVSQIISDMSSTTQTRSMTRVVKDQGEPLQMFNDDFHTWFEEPDHPIKVYKVVKALYSLHQAPRAWYETLDNYLLENGFQRGKIDQILFIKRQKEDILL